MTTPSDIDISIILPSYNEQAGIEQTLARIRASLDKTGRSWEIIVVDDCSTDSMPEIAARLAREDPRIRVIRNPINLGAGAGVLVGLRAARGKIRMHNSMDLPFDPDDLPLVLSRFPKADVVIVKRLNRAAHAPWRKVTSLTHHWLVRALFWVKIRDMNFVQAYKAEVVDALPCKARSPSFVTAELLIRAKQRGFNLEEIELTFHPRTHGVASYGKPRDILWALADMFALRLEGF